MFSAFSSRTTTRVWLLCVGIQLATQLTTATSLVADEVPAATGVSDPAIRRLKMPRTASNDPVIIGLQESPGQAAAVIVNSTPLIHTAQLLPLSNDHQTATAATVISGDASAQLARVYERLDQILRGAGSSTSQIVKLNVYVANATVAATVRDDLAKRFHSAPPAICFVETALPLTDALVAVDAVAVATTPKAVDQAASAVNAVVNAAITPAGSRVYVAGQAEKGDLRTATRKTLESLEATLKFLRLNWSDVAQIKSFVTPMAAARDADDEIRRFFAARNASVPPLVWVEWQSGLPIEIELVAAAGRGEPDAVQAGHASDVEFLTPPGMTTPTIYSRVTRIPKGPTIFVSGLYGVPNSSGGDQVERIFAQLKTVLAAAGGDFEHLAKATYYVSDNDASVKLNELRPRYYNPKRPPAASKAQVVGVALPGATITLDMIAIPRPKP